MNKEELVEGLSTAVKEGNIEESGVLAEKGVEADYNRVRELHIPENH